MSGRVRLILAWYDCWVGFYYDRKTTDLYIFPIPMVGICIKLNPWHNHRSCEICGKQPRNQDMTVEWTFFHPLVSGDDNATGWRYACGPCRRKYNGDPYGNRGAT